MVVLERKHSLSPRERPFSQTVLTQPGFVPLHLVSRADSCDPEDTGPSTSRNHRPPSGCGCQDGPASSGHSSTPSLRHDFHKDHHMLGASLATTGLDGSPEVGWGIRETETERERESSPGRNSEMPWTVLCPRTKAGLLVWTEGRWYSLG